MTKKEDGAGFVNPASLWGKPLPKMLQPTTPKGSTEPKKEKDSGMGRNESKDIDLDSDVDDELEVDGPSDAELLDDDETTAETVEETFVEVSATVSVDDDEDDTEDEDDDTEDEEEDVEAVVEDDGAESAVDEADDDEVEPTRRSRTVSTKKSMSDHVRDEIAKRSASGDSLRGVDIMNALAKRGVKVSAAQISQLLKKAGVSAKARGPRKHKAVAAPVEAGERSRMASSTRKTAEKKPTGRMANKATPSVSGELPVERLRAAKAFLAACGGTYAQATKTLELHEQLQSVMRDIG